MRPVEATDVEEAVIPILRVADANRAVAWYERLGFTKESEHRFGPGMPAFVTVARGSVRLLRSIEDQDRNTADRASCYVRGAVQRMVRETGSWRGPWPCHRGGASQRDAPGAASGYKRARHTRGTELHAGRRPGRPIQRALGMGASHCRGMTGSRLQA